MGNARCGCAASTDAPIEAAVVKSQGMDARSGAGGARTCKAPAPPNEAAIMDDRKDSRKVRAWMPVLEFAGG